MSSSTLRILNPVFRMRLRIPVQTVTRHYATGFSSGPAPPRLSKEEQELYERLQRHSTGAFSTPRPQINQSPQQSQPRPEINQSPQASSTSPTNDAGSPDEMAAQFDARIEAEGEGEELHPDVRRGARPEFEGERNPKTGEVGGPKNEPLRWGAGGDYSYNGRVTDF